MSFSFEPVQREKKAYMSSVFCSFEPVKELIPKVLSMYNYMDRWHTTKISSTSKSTRNELAQVSNEMKKTIDIMLNRGCASMLSLQYRSKRHVQLIKRRNIP